MLFHLQTDHHADCPRVLGALVHAGHQKLLSVDSLCLSLSDWSNPHCCSNPCSPVAAFQPPPPAGGISGSSGSPPAKQVGAVSGGQGKADWAEGSLAEVVAGLKEGQEGMRSPRPLLVHPTLLLILAAFWTLSDDRG